MRCYYLNKDYFLRKQEQMRDYVAKNRERINEKNKKNYHLRKERQKMQTEQIQEPTN